MRLCSLLFCFLFSSLYDPCLKAGNLEKGFEALKMFNYFEAKNYFEKAMKKQPAGAAYGLSTIYYRDDNPFHFIDSAYKYILRSENAFTATELKERERLKESGVTKRSIQALKEKILIRAFDNAKAKNTIEAYNRFLANFKHTTLEQQARHLKSALSFSMAKQKNTAQAYKAFIDSFPNAIEVKDARWLYDFTLFNTETKPRDIKTFEAFIKKFPNSPYLSQAQDSIFLLATPKKNREQLLSFIKTYPKNSNVKRAWDMVYAIASSDFTPNALTNFLFDHPEFPDPERVQRDIRLAKMNFYAVREKNKWGFMDSAGQVRIPCQFDWVENFSEGLALAVSSDSTGYVHKSGLWTIPPLYNEGQSFKGGLAVVSVKEQYGLIDRTGRIVIPIAQDDISNESSLENSRLIRVRNDSTVRYYSPNGEKKLELTAESAGDFYEGKAFIIRQGLFGYINKEGEIIVTPQFEWAENFRAGYARIRMNGKYGILDSAGKILIPCTYERIDEFKEGLALVIQDNKFGFVDTSGKIKIPINYEVFPELAAGKGFENGVTKIQKAKKQGLIDREGKFVLSAVFDDLRLFSEELCAAKKGKWGYVDGKGINRIKYSFDYAWDFKQGLARVQQKGKVGYIDDSGKWVIKPIFDAAEDFIDGLAVVEAEGKKGVIDSAGKWVLEPLYSEINRSENGLLQIKKVTNPDNPEGDYKLAWFSTIRNEIIWKEAGF